MDFEPGIAGRVTLKLIDVRWDQAFDILARVNSVRWRREGDRIFVWRRPGPSELDQPIAKVGTLPPPALTLMTAPREARVTAPVSRPRT